jgi:pimeloyl-ACP methyl ester carboxylesterase
MGTPPTPSSPTEPGAGPPGEPARSRGGLDRLARPFARGFARATAAALRASGLRPETLEHAGGWRVRLWRGGRPGGEPWLLLHGLGATTATFLPLLHHLQHLKVDVDLALPELSELGGTVGPRPAPSVPEAVDLVRAVARHAFGAPGGRRPTLAGVSLGGWIAVKAAIADPEAFARLLLVVPGGYVDQDWDRIERMVRVRTIEDIDELWRALFVRPPWYLRLGRPFLFLAYRSSAVAAILETVRREDAYGAAELAALRLPVGLVWGERDTLFRAEVGEAMRRVLPRATLAVVPAAAHGLQWERGRDFFAAVDEFRRAFPCAPLPAAAGGAQNPAAADRA